MGPSGARVPVALGDRSFEGRTRSPALRGILRRLPHGMKNASGDYDYNTNRFPRLGQVVDLDQIGTDRDRWASYTQNFSAAQNTLYAGYPWRFTHFRKTAGYPPTSRLTGIWARSPLPP